MKGKENHNIILLETANKEESLRNVKIATKRAIMDYEAKRRVNDESFDVYDYLQQELNEGFAEATVRRHLNVSNNSMFEPEKLLVLCDLIGDYRPVDILINYLTFRKSIKGC